MIQKIEPAAAIRLLDAKKAQAVDVREPDEYAVGHIPGAKLLPLGEVMSPRAAVSVSALFALTVCWLTIFRRRREVGAVYDAQPATAA